MSFVCLSGFLFDWVLVLGKFAIFTSFFYFCCRVFVIFCVKSVPFLEKSLPLMITALYLCVISDFTKSQGMHGVYEKH